MLRRTSIRRLGAVAATRNVAIASLSTSSDAQVAADTLVHAIKCRQHDAHARIEPRNFSFSGCGFLLPYHIGIADVLTDLGFITPTSRVAGASGGAIIAAAIAANVDLMQVHADAKAMAASGRATGTWGNVEPGLRETFKERFHGVDIDALSKSSRLTITTQQVWPRREIVHSDSFHSAEDLCDALIASCFIPFYLSRQATSNFRGEHHVDGGLVKLVPELPDHVRVSAFHAHILRRPDYEISPSLDSTFPYTVWELAKYSLLPADEDVLDELFQLGRKTAAIWADSQVNATS